MCDRMVTCCSREVREIKKFDAYDGMCLAGGLVFFAPVALLVRTQAGVSERQFFLLQALLSGIVAVCEIPTGRLTDRIGYRNSLIVSQSLLLTARLLLTAAFLARSLPLFVLEAVAEGLAACFASGTDSAYLYARYGEEAYLVKSAHAANFGTAGFLLSTAAYAALYRFFSLKGLLFATVLSGAAGLLFSVFLRREPPQARRRERARLAKLLCDRRALLFTALLAAFSVAWLLINFFYVEKLQDCWIPLGWMTAVIFVYSAVQMLAEPIIRLLKRRRATHLTVRFGLLSGVALLLFGRLRAAWLVLPFMAVLPLLLDLASFHLEEQQNRLIDALRIGSDRATALSVMNVGVSLVETLSLFASSLLVAVGASWCFCLCGVLLILGAIGIFYQKSV